MSDLFARSTRAHVPPKHLSQVTFGIRNPVTWLTYKLGQNEREIYIHPLHRPPPHKKIKDFEEVEGGGGIGRQE